MQILIETQSGDLLNCDTVEVIGVRHKRPTMASFDRVSGRTHPSDPGWLRVCAFTRSGDSFTLANVREDDDPAAARVMKRIASSLALSNLKVRRGVVRIIRHKTYANV